MRLVLSLPAPWRPRRDRAGLACTTWTIPGAGAVARVGPIEPLPADRARWRADVVGRDLPADATAETFAEVATTGAHGWPVTMVKVGLRDAAGAPIELRVAFCYELLELGAVFAIRIPARAVPRWDAALERPVLERALAATPDFRGPIAAVAQLYDMSGDD